MNLKGAETMRKNREAREQKRREAMQEKASMRKALREVLESNLTTLEQKLEASKILHELTS